MAASCCGVQTRPQSTARIAGEREEQEERDSADHGQDRHGGQQSADQVADQRGSPFRRF